MNTIPNTMWQNEFGLDAKRSPGFFISQIELDSYDALGAAHVVRRAFEVLELDGVLCDQNNPLIYFKVVDQSNPEEMVNLHRRFWNHGGAPVLVVITPTTVEIYSSLVQPANTGVIADVHPGLVETLGRVSSQLQELLAAIESGEFFRRHEKWFNPKGRVDRILLDQLQATREKLGTIRSGNATAEDLDALLCRLVFTCYLFDREIIGKSYLAEIDLPNLEHLRDVLRIGANSGTKPLYRLFEKLAQDFNGDLFNDDLRTEEKRLSIEHLEIVEAFFSATDVITGQRAFWPYDFGLIPIETVSAIYERFLKQSDKESGSFYTPRFLAELVLDVALKDRNSLLGLRFLDPACGSGIFLVGLFNQLAEEWRRNNPNARNDKRAGALMKLLQTSIWGVDINPTACRITAFSLYLAYLDQLTPRDIQELQKRGRVLPLLVTRLDKPDDSTPNGNIWCGDFFQEEAPYPRNVDLVIGNPPWGSIADKDTPAVRWCEAQGLEIPNKQIAAAFMWKTVRHISENGHVCLVLPHGILFNHNDTAVDFQKSFIERHRLDLVLNLTDYQSFLFSEARHPALIMKYRGSKPDKKHIIEYWTPKTDWKVTKAEIITISEYDRSALTIQSILNDLQGIDAPQIWKRMAWASPRDRRLLERLGDFSRLREHIKQAAEKPSDKAWMIAEGFQPFGQNDLPGSEKRVELPTRLFVPARSENLNLFLLPEDCQTLDSHIVTTRRGIRDTRIFDAPHVLVAKGFGSIAFADFAVTFRHALRGISGSAKDRSLLMFLTAYMRSPLAQYFLFHTSSNWGVSRNEVHVKELLRLPFPFPGETIDPSRAEQIVEEVAHYVLNAIHKAKDEFVDRPNLVASTQAQVNPLIYEYFDVIPSERILVEDTVRLTIPSFRPSSYRPLVPTIMPSTDPEVAQYNSRLCATLNGWTKDSIYQVTGATVISRKMGVGLIVLEKIEHGNSSSIPSDNSNLLNPLKFLQDSSAVKINTLELLRGLKIFDGNRLYILKPLGRRYWSETAALNDADEIASSILMQSSWETA